MIRIPALLAVLFIALRASAQWSAGGLTITSASHARPMGAIPTDLRGGGAPYNDLCVNAIVRTLPADGTITFSGDNTGSTDTEEFGNPVSWEAFVIDTCSTVTVGFCGTDPLFELAYSILIVGCPDFIANVANSGTSECADGNVIVTYEALPPGTYYIPVLRTAGAVGPYAMTLTSDACDLPPANDECANAQVLAVVQDCALGLVAGNNANTVVNTAPPCATTGSQFQDVWYQFDSGTNTEVTITIDPGTIGDIGVEVRATCGGGSVLCATGDTAYPVQVEPGTTYRVRVFSNNDFGFGGTFGICITVPGDCAAGSVTALGGAGSATACANGGDPLIFEHTGTSGEGLALVLTDAEGTIVSLLNGITLDPEGLAPGEYRLWGLAFDGELVGTETGAQLVGISTTGACLDISDAPVLVTIEICAGMTDPAGVPREMFLSCTPDGPLLSWLAEEATVRLELLDMRGALAAVRTLRLRPGQTVPLLSEGSLSPGLYAVRILRPGVSSLAGRVFVH